MNLGKYGFLTPEETQKIIDYFRSKYQEEIAGDVGWPGPGEKIGFAPAYMMFESELVSEKEQDEYFDKKGDEEPGIDCGFWTTDNCGIKSQSILKSANGTFEHWVNGREIAFNLNLDQALRVFNMSHVPTEEERLLGLKTLSHETYLMVAQHLDPDDTAFDDEDAAIKAAGWCEQYLEEQLLKAYKSGQGL
jgi:hypothetical protein